MAVSGLNGRSAHAWIQKLAFALTALCSGTVFAHDSGSKSIDISWYLFDYPPSYITSGPYKEQGYQDLILADLEQSLPSMRIHRVATSVALVMANLEHEKGACAGALAKTPERMAHMVFSDPILVSMPIRLVVREDMMPTLLPFLDDKGQVMLPALTKAEGLRAGIVQGRVYGHALDDALAEEARSGNAVRAGQGHLVFRMLARGRIGYTFGYPDEVGFYVRMLEREGVEAKLATLPVVGYSANSHSHIGCTKDAAGEAFIAAVNHILAEQETHARWQSYYLDWVDPSARSDIAAAIAQKAP